MELSLKSESLTAVWRVKVDEAKQRYDEDPTEENRREYKRMIKLFADVVLRYAEPPECDRDQWRQGA